MYYLYLQTIAQARPVHAIVLKDKMKSDIQIISIHEFVIKDKNDMELKMKAY